jgi:hypothetical protein
MMDAIASPPSSARDNLWRQAKAVAEEEPAEAARISRELSAVSESKSVHEEIIRSLTHVLLDRLTYKKVSVVRFLQDLSTKRPYVKDFLLREGGIAALAAVISGPDDATRNYSTQLLMSLGREDSMHKECVIACLEQLRDADNGIKAKIAICRVLNVIMLHDNGATIMECNGVVDIARVMTEDPSWDSFAVRTLSALAAAEPTAGDGQSKRADHITHALISVASGEQGGGNLRGNLARMLSMLSGQNKTGSLQQESSSNGLFIVASLLKEEEDAARAYATECLLNVCKRGARMKQGGGGTGSSDSNSEFVASYVIAELVRVLKDGESDERVTPKTMEKACRVVADVIVDRDGVWRESAMWNEKELVTELGKVVGESEGAGSIAATVWASRVLLAGCRAPPGSSIGDVAMLKVQNRKRMMDSTVGDQFRWALNQHGAKREAFVHMKAFMSEAGISEVGVPGLKHHLKIVMKNVEPYEYSYVENGGGSGQVSYDGERGHRIYTAVTNIRKKLSSGNQDDVSDDVDTVIDSGVLPYLIALLGSDADKHPDLEEEVLWVITNMVSGTTEQTCAVVEAGALPSMIRLVNSSNPTVQDQAVWGLGNISGDSAMCRNEVFDCGIVAAVQEAHANGVLGNAKNMEDIAFLIMNLMRMKPLPHIDETKGLLPIITDFVKHLQVKDVVYNKQGRNINILEQMLIALSAFTAQDEHGELSMDIVLGEKIMPTLSRIMNQVIHRKPGGSVAGDAEILEPLCRIFGNFCGGSEQHTQAILDIDGVDLLFLLANHEHEGLRKEAWFALSNMAAGSESQVTTLIEKGVFSRAFDVMSHTDWSIDKRGSGASPDSFYLGAPQNIKNEICWCICNPLPDAEDPGSHQTKRAITDAVLGSRHSQAGDKHDEEDRFHGLTAIFESVAVLERQVREREGDVAKNVEMATKLMGLIKCLTSDESLALHGGIKAKIKEKGKRYVAIIKSILKQPGDIARIAEDVTEQIIMHI